MIDVGTIKLETERLLLRRLEITDANEMFNGWCNDGDVTRYLPWDIHGNINVTNTLLRIWIDDYNNKFTYRWIIIEKESNKPIGTIDVVSKNVENRVFELGHCYKKDCWGKGYATQATE